MDEILAEILNLIESGEQLSDELLELIQEFLQSEEELEEPSESARLLWTLSGGQPQAFVSYLREFPDPALQELLRDPNLLNRTIQQLQQNYPIEIAGQTDGFQQAPLQSSNVYGFRFDPQTKKLKVRFQSGSVYEYGGVPDLIFNLFSHGNADAQTNGRNRYGRWWRGKNPSLGAALNQYIKAGGFPYRKLR